MQQPHSLTTLVTVAALLPRPWNTRLVDMNVSALTDNAIAWADYVFISAMTAQQASAREVIARSHAAGVRVVGGGPLFTVQPELFPEVDHLVLNEAELILPRFLADLERGTPQRLYTTTEFADLRQSPLPRRELLDLGQYADMSVQYSQGCPHDCEFCNVTTLFGRRARTKYPPGHRRTGSALRARLA